MARCSRSGRTRPRDSTAGIATDLGTFPSIYGTLKLCAGNELTYTVPLSEPTSALDLSASSARTRSPSSASRWPRTSPPPRTCAGRHLLRRQDALPGGEAATSSPSSWASTSRAATHARRASPSELTKWTEPKGCDTRSEFCFVYDEQAKGIVGLTPSFGSDEFNDHHFHYGYFLYAAGVLAAGRPGAGREAAAGDGPARGRHRLERGQRGLPRPPRVRRLRRPLVGLGHLPVRRRQQPGVELRGGHRLDRAGAVGEGRRQRRRWTAEAIWMLSTEAQRRRWTTGPTSTPPSRSTPGSSTRS